MEPQGPFSHRESLKFSGLGPYNAAALTSCASTRHRPGRSTRPNGYPHPAGPVDKAQMGTLNRSLQSYWEGRPGAAVWV
eukprot:scaffold185184_cov29-Tisochrysis_lutea.AAC.4